ncbi:flavin mononucleotide reductase [Acetobacter malorum DSM 14337]|uniref:Flavin mononucleotide reductase n=1 Tax=Acetobacter malorum DSM 14337 TaxID=1307910 RepID=A0ABQ0PT36_9PROT|nr:flavin reductase [Acetobacter malorum]KXV04930.1 flavin reductase [Acetobacter malorum]GBQ80374.1 flavin mononucleotide reductase [Acetobacter malorum DSM 14337]
MLHDTTILFPQNTFEAPGVSKEQFREAMSLLGAPVVLVTTHGPGGRQGLTVSAISSVSDAPPTVLVCLNRNNRSHQAFLQNGVIGISVLSPVHHDLARIFSSRSVAPDEKFAQGNWVIGDTGSALLADALVTLDCEIDAIHSAGTHDVLFCAVKSISTSADAEQGLAWFSHNFHPLPVKRA